MEHIKKQIGEMTKDTSCFYKDGLYFSCKQGCRDCCANEPGFVFLDDCDIRNIADATGLSMDEAISLYSREVELGNKGEKFRVLKEYSDNRCIFLKDFGCSIYNFRPRQCAAYPFWDRIIASEKAWNNEAKMCRGINDKSNKVSCDEIEKACRSFHFPDF